MSLVGFRPALKSEYEEYEYHHKARIAMKPGITGMWQVSGRSDITDFEEVVKLDTEYIRNWSIDQIFESCEDLIDGKFISGAGGGGFLQVILKKGVTKEHLRRRLRNVFQDSGVDMWESEFLW